MKKFKKIILASSCALLLSITNVVLATTGTITGKTVRIRENADSSSKIVDNVYRNDEVNVVGEEGDWYKVQYSGQSGYISKEFVNVNGEVPVDTTAANANNQAEPENNTQPTEENVEENTPVDNSVRIIKEASLKLLPIFSSRTIGVIQANTEIQVKREVNNWVQITVGSNTGWVLKNNVSSFSKKSDADVNNTPASTVETPEATAEVTEQPENVETTENQENTSNYESQVGYVNTDTVRIRETAGGKIIGNLDIDDVVTILGEEGDWYKVSCNGFKEGYVSKSLITVGKVSSRSLAEERALVEVLTSEEIENAVEAYVQESNNNEQEESQPEVIVEEEIEQVEVEENNADEESEPEEDNEPEPEYVPSGDSGSDIVEFAENFLGCRYVYGGSSPSGFDCSGFTSYVYSNFGYSLNRTASGQADNGEEVSYDELEPGDLLLFEDSGRTRIGHAAIYIGDGEFIHAANPSSGVTIDSLDTGYYAERYVTARRME